MSETERFAQEFTAMMAGTQPESRDRDTAEAAEPTTGTVLDLLAPASRDIALIKAMHGEPEPVMSDDVDFDGGVRTTATPPSDPVREHDELLFGLRND